MTLNTSEATQEWLLSHRKAWYEQTDLKVSKVAEREFMAVWGGETQRHLSYKDKHALQSAMATCPPDALFASAACYYRPGSTWMHEKGWKYAAMVFDFDYDHMECALFDEIAEGDMGDKTWGRSKSKALECLDVLREKFGTDRFDICFSGSRGFHVRLLDPRYMPLGKVPRLALAQYMQDLGLDIDAPVLVDMHRVSRVPGSIHPSKGLVCTPLTEAELKSFHPRQARADLGGYVVDSDGRKVRDGYAYEQAVLGNLEVDSEWWSEQETKAPTKAQLIL